MQLPSNEGGQKIAAIFAGLLGLVLIGAGWFMWKSGSEPEVEILRNVDEMEEGVIEEIVVDVEGELVRPGVYKMKQGARVGDVIEAAGGFTGEADVLWVELHVNKAEKVVDGYKLYIPNVKAMEIGVVAGKNTSGIISINYASQSELESLPGVGAVTAGKIIQGRPYNSIEDLKKEKVVSQKVFEQIQTLIGL